MKSCMGIKMGQNSKLQFTPSEPQIRHPVQSKGSTGWGISFHTLEMSFLWWTGSSQKFLRKYQMKKVSFSHYLKILMKSSKHGISYTLKRHPRSLSIITFYANLKVSPIQSFDDFSKTMLFVVQVSNTLA